MIDPARRVDGEVSTGSNSALDAKRERVLQVVAHAIAVFGDRKKALHWLRTPLPLLGDRSPSQLLEGREGIKLVEQVLTRIEHNIPS
jgi:putative toxin-antitoxin system antitoxin component (TIGR02293 family)